MAKKKKLTPKENALVLGFFFSLVVFATGLALAVVSVSPDKCGGSSVGARGQSACVATPEDNFNSVKVHMNRGNGKDFVTYIYTTQPKRGNFSEYVEFKMSGDDSYTFYVPSTNGTAIRFWLNVNKKVNIRFAEPGFDELYSKKDVKSLEDSFVIQGFTTARFIIEGDEHFSGNLLVNATFLHYDVDSANPVDNCSAYPCEWDFSEARFKDKTVYVITNNYGLVPSSPRALFSQVDMIFVYVGVPIAVIGAGVFVALIFVAKKIL